MTLWCRHTHEQELERFYAEPVAEAQHLKGDAETMERLLFGVTTLRLECVACERVRELELLGKPLPWPS